jgi:putative nucleotidyltransferase with HDIG domain
MSGDRSRFVLRPRRFLAGAPLARLSIPAGLRFLRSEPRVWGGLFLVVCAIVLLPWLSSREIPLVVGHPVAGDVVATRELLIVDDEATEARRRRVEDEVPLVHDLDADLAGELLPKLERSFAAARRVAGPVGGDTWWRDIEATFELPITRSEAESFGQAGFPRPIEAAVGAIVSEAYARGVVGFESSPPGSPRLLRNLHTGEETLAPDNSPEWIRWESGVRSFAAERLAERDGSVGPSLRREIASFVARIVAPSVTFNRRETDRRRREAGERAGNVTVRIPAGTVVLRAGEVVTPSGARLAGKVMDAGREGRWQRYAGGVGACALLALLAWPLILRATSSRRRTVLGYSIALLSSTLGILLTYGLARLAIALGGGGALPWRELAPALPHSTGAFLAGLLAGAPAAAIAAVLGAATTGVLFGASFRWVLQPLVTGLAATFAFDRPRSRSAVLKAGILVGLVGVAASLAFRALEPSPPQGGILREAVAAFLSGPISAMFAAFLVPAVESLFGVATDLKLLELANQNLPILRRLAVEAPGTYQHCLLVGTLSEAAAEAIGANPLLARVGAYYHDIGKISKPGYFVENGRRGENRHDRLSPSMSCLIIAHHVREGVRLAREARLPETVVDAIRQHHGTKPIRFFYQKALALSTENSRVEEDDFRYPGPRPDTREWGILLLADAVEAASRTLSDPTPTRLAALVDAIIDDSLDDGQLDGCPLTFEELGKVRTQFLRSLAALHHHRIDYPGFDFNKLAERRKRHADPGLARGQASGRRIRSA